MPDDDFMSAAHARLEALEKKHAALEKKHQSHVLATKDFQDNMQGDGNIRFEGGKIVLTKQTGSGTGTGSSTTAGTKTIIIDDNGTLYYYLIAVTFLGPV